MLHMGGPLSGLAHCLLLLAAASHPADCRRVMQAPAAAPDEAPAVGAPAPATPADEGAVAGAGAPGPQPRPEQGLARSNPLDVDREDIEPVAEPEESPPPPSPPLPSPPPPADDDQEREVAPEEEEQQEEEEEQDGDGDESSLTIQEDSLATRGSVPPAEGFTPVVVDPKFRGTCSLQQGDRQKCDDGMGLSDGTTPEDYRLMYDPDEVEGCGLVALSKAVQESTILEYAFKGPEWGDCGVKAFTTVRVCVGEGRAEGRWRARMLLWPDGDCKPLCIKMTGEGEEVADWGRTRTC